MAEQSPFKKITHNSLSFEVADKIKDAILSGFYQPGDKLPSERNLAEVFGVGRPTIREAVKTLSERGLVEINRGSKGTTVKKPDLLQGVSSMREQMSWLIQVNESTIADFWEVIPYLICMIAHAAAGKLKDHHNLKIDQLLDQMESQLADFPEILRGLNEIIRIEAEASENVVAYMLWELFRDVLEKQFPPLVKIVEPSGKGVLALQFHKDLVSAVRQEDHDKIDLIVRKRWLYLREAYPPA